MSQKIKIAFIWAGDYIAAVHEGDQGHRDILMAALDSSDSVWIQDSYTYEAAFCTEFERFDRNAVG